MTIFEQFVTKPFNEWLDKDENKSLRLPITVSGITFLLWLILLGLHFALNISLVTEILGALPVTLRYEITDWLPTWFIILGIVLCVYAASIVVHGFRKKAKYYGALIVLLAATLHIISWYLLQPSKKEDATAIVAVARFTPVGGTSEDDAIAIARRIRDQLSSRFAELSKDEAGQTPLGKVKFLKNAKIEGSDDDELRLAAINEAKRASADLIVWGEVCKEKGMLKATPKISITGSSYKPKAEFWIAIPEDFKPPHLNFKEEIAQDTSRLATFVCGLVYFFRNKPERALPIFQHIGDPASHFYTGLIFSERARNSLAPEKDLLEAKALFERVIGAVQNSANIMDQELRWDAALNLGNTFLSLGIMSNPDTSQSLFQQAIDLYDQALKISPIVRLPTAQARVQISLGLALIEIAIRKPPLEQRPILDRAVAMLESSLRSYGKNDSSDEFAVAQVHLSIAMRYLSRISDKEVRKELLKSAITYLNKAERNFYRTDRINWAVVQVNKAATLCELSRIESGDEQRRLLQSSITSLRALPDLQLEKQDPYLWAMAKYDLGNSLRDLADISDKDKNLYGEALQSYQDALRVFSLDQYPTKWAETQEMIALAFLALAQSGDKQQAKDLLGKAVIASDSALRVYSPTGSPHDWGQAQLRRARILAITSFYQKPEDRNKTLTDAQDSLRKALTVLTRDTDPEKWAEAELMMGGIAAFLGKPEGDLDRRIEFNKQSVCHLRTALTVFTFEQHPDMWARAKCKLGDVLRQLGLLVSGDEGKRYLSDAVLEYREALRVNTRILDPYLPEHLLFSLSATLGEIGLRSDHSEYGGFFRECAETYLEALGFAKTPTESNDVHLPLSPGTGEIQIEGHGIEKHLNDAVRILSAASTKSNLRVDERAYLDFALGMVLFQLAILSDDCEIIMDQLQGASSKLESSLTFFDGNQYPREHLFLQKIQGIVRQLRTRLNDAKLRDR